MIKGSRSGKKRFFKVIDNKDCGAKKCTKCTGRGRYIGGGIIIKICEECHGSGLLSEDLLVVKKRGRPKKIKE